jgi:glycosyltransferase involved in cell wall biosynthesis
VKILHLIHSADPKGGGPIEAILQLGQIAASSGHQVEVASLDPPDGTFLASFPLKLHSLGPSFSGYGYTPVLARWLRQNAAHYDIVIVNGIWQYHSFACWQALRNTPIPYVVFTHGMLDPWFKRRYPLKHFKKWMYWPWGDYCVLRDAAAVLFTCEEERMLARQSFWLYRARERVVNFGTGSPPGDEDAQREEFSQRFPETRGKRVLLFMGRIHPKKGCDLAIEAFAKVLASDSEWHFVLAGPDQIGWQARLLHLVEKHKIGARITWAGMVRGNLKWGAIRSAEVLFLPSHQENFGIVVAEALACGVPVLISNRVNIWREVLADGAGLIEPDNTLGATSLLRQWTNMAAHSRAAMRLAARRSFASRFEIQRASDSLVSTLSDITDQCSYACARPSQSPETISARPKQTGTL